MIRQLRDPRRDAELQHLAVGANREIVRQIAFASLINFSGKTDEAWKLAHSGADNLRNFIGAVPYLSDASVRAGLYDKIAPLLNGLPSDLREKSASQPDEAIQIRRAAMRALTQIRGREAQTFQILSRFVRDDVDRVAAVRALQAIPRSAWPKDEAVALRRSSSSRYNARRSGSAPGPMRSTCSSSAMPYQRCCLRWKRRSCVLSSAN